MIVKKENISSYVFKGQCIKACGDPWQGQKLFDPPQEVYVVSLTGLKYDVMILDEDLKNGVCVVKKDNSRYLNCFKLIFVSIHVTQKLLFELETQFIDYNEYLFIWKDLTIINENK